MDTFNLVILLISLLTIFSSGVILGLQIAKQQLRKEMPDYWRWKILTKPSSDLFEELYKYKSTGGGKMGW